MNPCYFCKVGETKPGFVDNTIVLGRLTVVVKGIPAAVCGNCGESYYECGVVSALEKIIADARKNGVETLVRKYAPAKAHAPMNGAVAAQASVQRPTQTPYSTSGAPKAKAPLAPAPTPAPAAIETETPQSALDAAKSARKRTLSEMSAQPDCPICINGEIRLTGDTSVTAARGDMVMVVKGVPADVCDNCGEKYARTDAMAAIDAMADEAESDGVEFMVRKYAADALAQQERS